MTEAINNFLQSFQSLCPEITEEELDFIKSGTLISVYKKKEFYLDKTAVQKSIGFVYNGLIRCFYLNNSGKEITTNFIKEGEYATDYAAFLRQEKTMYCFECLEDCILTSLSFETLQHGYNKYKTSEKIGRLIAEKVVEIRSKRLDSFLFNTAEERYLDFISAKPDLFNRVSLTHLSSYLGIERQSLSRIRKKISIK